MAKNLQNILNEVVGEILQENEGMPITPGGEVSVGSFLGAPNTDVDTSGIEIKTIPGQASLGKEIRDTQLSGALSDLPKTQAGFNELVKNRFISGMNNSNLGDVSGLPGSSPIAKAEEMGVLDRLSNMASNAKNSVGEFWDARTTPEKVGIGALMAAPLAAGAGALYLRKKQRAANKAAGVR